MKFLPEYQESARLALELAIKEVKYLTYTHQTLFMQTLDLEWVQSLNEHQDRAEKVDAFVSRFGRLQDHIGEKLIPRFSVLLGESPKSLLDVITYAEKMDWIDNAETFVRARKLRNLLVHEYIKEAKLFLETLKSADKATLMLISVVDKMAQYAKNIGLVE